MNHHESYVMVFVFVEFSKQLPLSIFGKSLCGIIDEYYILKNAERQVWNLKNRTKGRKQKFLNMWKTLEDAVATVK